MDVPVRAARQPRLDPRGFVRGVVVHHQVHVWPFRQRGIDLLQKEKLGRPVPLIALPDDCPCGDIERSEQ